MATQLTHKCIVCGTRYHSCDTCERIRTYTPWRSICDSFEHYKVYLALRAYEEGFNSKEETKEALEVLGVKKGTYGDWQPKVVEKLDKIFAESKRSKKAKIEPVVEEVVTEDVTELEVAEAIEE
jgi:hypothetical protein